jgi:trans-aconitate 2-methyltransferase
MWDPQRYLSFAGERSRPFHELMARVGASRPEYVVDLGCGPGNLTATLAERWPAAEVVGVDSSPEMVAAAKSAITGVTFVEADLTEWRPARPVDVLVSNATLQWVPGHLELLARLVGWLAKDGWLAFHVPSNFREPSHTLLRDVADSPRWRDRVGADVVARPASYEPSDYLDALAAAGCTVDVWETTYLQVLPGENPVLEWVSGTALRPIFAVLDEAERAEFCAEYGALLCEAYPRRAYGTALPYRRIFVVAQQDRPRPH